MTQETINNILEIYDAAKDKGKAMNQICALFHVHKDELKTLLHDNGRKLRSGRPSGHKKITLEDSTEDPEKAADLSEYNSAKVGTTPEYVKQVLEEKVEDLSAEIAHLEESIAEMESEKIKLNARIMEIHSFFNQFF